MQAHVYDSTSVPNDEFECYAAIYSQGKECKECHRSDCYRQGWEKYAVDQDNARLVEEKHAKRGKKGKCLVINDIIKI